MTLTGNLPGGIIGQTYLGGVSTTPLGTATPKRTFALVSGTLPPGLGLDATTGAIAGLPSTIGTYTFTIESYFQHGTRGSAPRRTIRQAFTIQVTDGVTPPPPAAGPILSMGEGFSCALTPVRAVKCWGGNSNGELGNGTTTNSATPVQVTGLTSGVQTISSGWSHSCAVTSVGAVQCWGDNDRFGLGDGTTTNSATPVQVVGLSSGVQAISTGWSHLCAVTSVGAVKCWGWNAIGQLGDGTTTDSATPVQVVGLTSGVQAISTGWSHSCALLADGSVKCWGGNSNGELGDGTTTNSATPVQVTGLTSGVQAISSGELHTCAAVADGAVKCWGYNGTGQLGDGTTTSSAVPVQVLGFP
jgi:alpha-tubulin suppressor-like RCC1 family protein